MLAMLAMFLLQKYSQGKKCEGNGFSLRGQGHKKLSSRPKSEL